MAEGIFDVNDIECAVVAFAVSDQTNSSQVSPSSSHNQVANIKLDEVQNLARTDIDLDRIVDADFGIRVANGSAIVCDAVGDSLLTESHTLHLA